MSEFLDGDPAFRAQAEPAEKVRSGEPAKPLSPAMLDWMRRIQEGSIRMASDEDYRKTIAARLF